MSISDEYLESQELSGDQRPTVQGGARGSIWLAAVVVAICALCTACSPPAPKPPPPPRHNIVLIVLDTLRAASMSLHGYERLTTPHIDRFAGGAVTFRSAVSVGGNTSTAMAGIMTGRSPFFEMGSEWNNRSMFGMNRFYKHSEELGLPEALDSLAERLQGAGYRTAGIITNPNVKRVFNFDRGFDSYLEIFDGNRFGNARRVSSAAIEFLNLDAEQPFFLYLHYMDVHGPYNPPATSYASCFGRPWPDAESNLKNWVVWEAAKGKKPHQLPKLHPLMTDLYDCSLRFLDDQVGRILATLHASGLLEESIVVITSDHGDEFLEHGETGHAGRLYAEMLQVPLIVHVPGQQPANVSAVVRNFDLMPTLLDLVGVEHDARELDAASLRLLLSGETEKSNRHVFANFPSLRMYRDARHKFLESRDGNILTFDLVRDPGELRPLPQRAADNPETDALWKKYVETVKSLQAAQRRGLPTKEHTARPADDQLMLDRSDFEGVDNTTLEQLRELGYVK